VEQVGGSWAAIFPASPADRIFNNALLVAGPDELISSIAALGDAYSTAGISNQALWCHEDDAPAGLALERHGYGLDETTRCMGGFLDEMGGVAVRDPRVRLGDPSELFSVNELDANLLTGLVFGAGRCYALDCGDGPQAVLLAFDCDGDCGLSFLATVPAARRRGMRERSSVMRSRTRVSAGAARRHCRRPRWPRVSMRRSAIAISAGSSNTGEIRDGLGSGAGSPRGFCAALSRTLPRFGSCANEQSGLRHVTLLVNVGPTALREQFAARRADLTVCAGAGPKPRGR
jgi:hypothetical protein